MMWIFRVVATLFLVVLLARQTVSAAEVVDNLEFLSQLTDSLLSEKTAGIFSNLHGSVQIRGLDVNTEVDWFFENRLVELLKKESAGPLYLEGQDTGREAVTTREHSPVHIVEYKVVSLGIEYIGRDANGMERGEHLGRKAVLSFFLRVIWHSSGKILLSEHVSGAKYDWLPVQDRNRIENRSIGFTMGVFHARAGSNKAAEALLLTGVSGVVIFLFYSLRSR